MSMSGAGERSLQIAWRDVDRCEDAGGQSEDRRCGATSVGGIPAAHGYRNGLIQSVGLAAPHQTSRRSASYFQLSGGQSENLAPAVVETSGGEWHPTPPFFQIGRKGPR